MKAVLLAVVAALAGCATPGAPGGEADGARSAGLACVEPCLRVVDEGHRWEPTIAVDPRDPLRVVAASLDTMDDPVTGQAGWWPLVHVSTDGGASWRTARIPGGPSSGPQHPLFRYNAMGDPVLAFLPDGTLLFSGIADQRVSRPLVPYTATGDALVVLRSTDGGLTFPEVVTVKEGSGVGGAADVAYDAQDKQGFAVGPGLVLLAWVRIVTDPTDPTDTVSSIVVSSSADGGRAWSPLRVVAQGDRLQGPAPLVLEDGAWLVAFVDQDAALAHVARSEDGGASWTAVELGTSTKFPVLAKGPGGRVYAAFPESAEGPDSAQAPVVRWSDDGGRSWSAPLRLDEPAGEGRVLPQLVVDEAGTAFVTFWHVRGGGAELRAVALRDGAPGAPLSLDAIDGPTRGVGDYMGLAPVPGGGAFAAWVAPREAGTQVVAARFG